MSRSHPFDRIRVVLKQHREGLTLTEVCAEAQTNAWGWLKKMMEDGQVVRERKTLARMHCARPVWAYRLKEEDHDDN